MLEQNDEWSLNRRCCFSLRVLAPPRSPALPAHRIAADAGASHYGLAL